MIYSLPRMLTIHEISNIAGGAAIRVSPEAKAQVKLYYEMANKIALTQPVYGRSTGVGANKQTATAIDSATHGMNLLRSHAVDAGPTLTVEETRALLTVRLNQLLHPGSGIDPSVIDGLERMLLDNSLPEVKHFGGIGTADLPALAGVGLALAGERPTSGAPFQPIGPIKADSALPFMSSSAPTLARAALTTVWLERLLEAAIATFALSSCGSRADMAAFSEDAARTVASPAAVENAVRLRVLLDGSEWVASRIQDPFCFRAFLPAVSTLSVATGRLREAVESQASHARENPRFFGEQQRAVHHGAFLETRLAHELDATAIAVAQTAPLILARLRFMNDDGFSGLPRFLAPDGGGNSGTMIVEYLAASAMGEVHAAAAPISTHSAVLSCGVEEDATFAPTALAKLSRALEAYELMIASEIVVAARTIRMRQGSAPLDVGDGITRLLELCASLPEGFEDRDLRHDVQLAREMIDGFAQTCRISTARLG